jgi:diguanylate cyclase (GGDEF)-like protein
MQTLTDQELPKSLPLKHKKHLREILGTLLDSTGNQREYLVSMLLSQVMPESGDEPSIRSVRALSASLMEQLVLILRADRDGQASRMTDYLSYLHQFPLEPETKFQHVLQIAFGHEGEPSDTQVLMFKKLELLYLLALMEDYESSRALLDELEPLSPDTPHLYLVYQLSLAKVLQQRNKRQRFTALWLNLVSDFYQIDGADTALYLVLRWVRMLKWGRDSALKKQVLNRFGTSWKRADSLISVLLLYELFTLETRLVNPSEKMHIVRLLLKQPVPYLNEQQMQYLHFFAGNYYSGMKSSFQESIRAYQHSTYYLHRSWTYLQGLSKFLRENLNPPDFARAMRFLEQWVVQLGSQVSLQNNAYVETLHANYDTIRDLYRQVEDLSITDNLTGLKNRRYLQHNLHHTFQLAARHNVPICFAMLDIDFFKQVNDQHGHLAGDQVLKSFARMLSGSFRKSDVVIRFGGDEFLLVFFDMRPDVLQKMMEELRGKVEAHRFTYQGTQIRITVSIGCVCEFHSGISSEQLDRNIETADVALYQAKSEGRNRVVVAPG